MSKGANERPDRSKRPVRPTSEGRTSARRPALFPAAVSVMAVAVAMWSRSQMQVSAQVVDSCTVGTAASAVPQDCTIRPEIRSPARGATVGTDPDRQTHGAAGAAPEETRDGRYTSFIF